MKCCGKDLGKGTPFVMVQYWCPVCETEHLVDAREMVEVVAKLNARIDELEQGNGNRLPSLL
jgi:uncharacterized Zn finger protein (UPF0148 family)